MVVVVVDVADDLICGWQWRWREEGGEMKGQDWLGETKGPLNGRIERRGSSERPGT